MNIPDDLNQPGPSDRREQGESRGRFHWRKRWREWINRRLPVSREITLNQKSIFIFPTRAGFGFLGFIVLLLLVAINFENSPVYALTFLLSSLFVVSILHTFSNLSGLKLTAAHAEPAFAGRDAIFHLVIAKNGARLYQGLQFFWPGNSPVWCGLTDKHEEWIALRYRTGPRGYCRPGRLKVQTSFPLGLLRAWTWLDLDMHTVVFPYPAKVGFVPPTSTQPHESGNTEQSGSDDFYGLRDYVAGDTVKSIAWKHYAKTGKLNTKQFIDPVDHRLWLVWDDTQGDIEHRLSQLCYWALEAERGHSEYGLQLPGVSIAPSRDQAHLDKVLRALAVYNKQPLKESQQGSTVSAGDTNARRAEAPNSKVPSAKVPNSEKVAAS